jgi:ABC-type branched-subunit amino acid transport system permease subunit
MSQGPEKATLVSLSVSVFLISVAYLFWPRRYLYLPFVHSINHDDPNRWVRWLYISPITLIAIGVICALLVKTGIGLRMRAYAADPISAASVGVAAKRFPFVLSITTGFVSCVVGVCIIGVNGFMGSTTNVISTALIALGALLIAYKRGTIAIVVAAICMAALQTLAHVHTYSFEKAIRDVEKTFAVHHLIAFDYSLIFAAVPAAIAIIGSLLVGIIKTGQHD